MALSREEIATRYGTALFGYAQDMKVLDQTHEQMQALAEAVKANPKIINLLSDPLINSEEKQKVLTAIEKPFSPEVKNFLNLLLDYERFADLLDIIACFNELYDRAKAIASGTAITAVKLDAKQLRLLYKSTAKRFHLKSVRLKNQVDPKIIGGVILQVRDQLIDGSVKTQLKKIRARIIDKK